MICWSWNIFYNIMVRKSQIKLHTHGRRDGNNSLVFFSGHRDNHYSNKEKNQKLQAGSISLANKYETAIMFSICQRRGTFQSSWTFSKLTQIVQLHDLYVFLCIQPLFVPASHQFYFIFIKFVLISMGSGSVPFLIFFLFFSS